MKNRIVLTILALVILPTAILSIMAGRAVRSRELVIMQQMKLSAESMTRLCAEKVDAAIEQELTRTKSSIGAVLMRTASAGELARTAETLAENSPVIDGIIVYHDPWEIIYPARRPASASGEQVQPSFIDLLRVEIAKNKTPNQVFHVNDDGTYYCFTFVPGRNDLYAGFRINLLGFRSMLNGIIEELATTDILLEATGRMYKSEDRVIVEDNLSPSPDQQPTTDPLAETSLRPLADKPLLKPFTDVTVTAYARNPDEVLQAGRNQGKLLIWGIALLSGGIIAGVVLLIFQVRSEIRRTSARANYIIGISHDLRTPIASLKMMTESLYSGTVTNPEKRQSFLATMAGECERLNRLVERVLYFVRYGEDALVFFKKTVDTSTLLKTCVESFSQSASGKREDVEFSMQIPKDLPEIAVDDNAISQVLLNLLDNALKYGKKSGKKTHITIAAEVLTRKRAALSPSRDWIRISVSDTGPGIEPSDLRRIFKPYYRSASAQNANNSGVGLGLALCRHIVKAHEGWIEAENLESSGAVFSVYLPAQQ